MVSFQPLLKHARRFLVVELHLSSSLRAGLDSTACITWGGGLCHQGEEHAEKGCQAWEVQSGKVCEQGVGQGEEVSKEVVLLAP